MSPQSGATEELLESTEELLLVSLSLHTALNSPGVAGNSPQTPNMVPGGL